jgi:hypothetical protein
MITFKLENKAAEAMIAVLNASNPNASFVEELKCQYDKQTAVAVEEPPVVVEIAEPAVEEVEAETKPTKSKSK